MNVRITVYQKFSSTPVVSGQEMVFNGFPPRFLRRYDGTFYERISVIANEAVYYQVDPNDVVPF